MDPSAFHWSDLFNNTGAFGLVGWIVWHILSKTIPDLLAKHALEMTHARDSFIAALRDQRTDFREELNHERSATAGLAGAITKLSADVLNHDMAMRIAHARELESERAKAEAK